MEFLKNKPNTPFERQQITAFFQAVMTGIVILVLTCSLSTTFAQYTGDYQIGGSGGDFSSISEAFDSLERYGVSGQVNLFIVEGSYHEQIVIDQIPGIGPGRQVYLRPATTNTDSVLIHYGFKTDSTGGSVLTIKESYVNIDSLYFKLDSGSTVYPNYTVYLGDSLGTNTITNCTFHGIAISKSNPHLTYLHIILRNFSGGSEAKINLRGNRFFNNSYGIVGGQGLTSGVDTFIVESNYFENTYRDAISLKGRNGIQIIRKNHIVKSRSSVLSESIDARSQFAFNFIIEENYLSCNTGGSYMVYLVGSSDTDSTASYCYNNVIDNNGSSRFPLSLTACNQTNIYHNTILHRGDTNDGPNAALYIAKNQDKLAVKNNSFFARSGGIAVYFVNLSGVDLDYNNYSSSSKKVIWEQGGLLYDFPSIWLSLSSEKNGSNNWVKYSYSGVATPFTTSIGLNNSGTALGIKSSFNGRSRSSSFPDIGAHEFDPYSFDLAACKVSVPVGCSNDSVDVYLHILNDGKNDFDSVSVKMQIFTQGDTSVIDSSYAFSIKSKSLDTLYLGKVSLKRSGLYQFEATIAHDSDQNALNNVAKFNELLELKIPFRFKNDTICPLQSTQFINKDSVGILHWYLHPAARKPLFTGHAFYTPQLIRNQKYYYRFVDFDPAIAADTFSTPSSGYIFTGTTPYGLQFTSKSEFTLDSCTIFPEDTGSFLIHVWNQNSVKILSSDTLKAKRKNFSPERLAVNLNIPQGKYTIGVEHLGSTKGLGRNTGYAGYPLYSTDSVLVVTGSTPGQTFYYWLYDWRITRPGCTSELDSVTVVVQAPRKPRLGNDTAYCSTDSFSHTIDAFDSTYTEYLWTTGDTSSSITITKAGIYNLRVTDSEGCWTSNLIEVKELKGVRFDLGNDTAYCEGSAFKMAISLDSSADMKHIRWNTGDTTRRIWVDTAGTHIAEVELVNGCSAHDTLVVYELSAPDFSLGPDKHFCMGDSVQLTLDPGPLDSVLHYRWNTKDTSQSINVNHEGEYSLEVTYTNSCSRLDSFSLMKVLNPKIDLGANQYLCPNQSDSVELGINQQFTSYLWQPDSSTHKKLKVYSPGIFVLQVSDSMGCTGSDSITVLLRNVHIDLGPDTAFCGNAIPDVTLSVSSKWANILWTTGSRDTSINFRSFGNVGVGVQDSVGCIASDSIEVKMLNYPVFRIMGDTLLNPANPVNEKLATSVVDPSFKYVWSTGDSTENITVKDTGSYQLTITDTNGCNASDTIHLVFWKSGNSSTLGSANIRIYPNPASGLVKINVDDASFKTYLVRITDLSGNLIHESAPVTKRSCQLPISHLSAGIYLLQIQSIDGSLKRINGRLVIK